MSPFRRVGTTILLYRLLNLFPSRLGLSLVNFQRICPRLTQPPLHYRKWWWVCVRSRSQGDWDTFTRPPQSSTCCRFLVLSSGVGNNLSDADAISSSPLHLNHWCIPVIPILTSRKNNDWLLEVFYVIFGGILLLNSGHMDNGLCWIEVHLQKSIT